MSLPSTNFLHPTVSEIYPGQDFIGQGHYCKVRGQIKVTSGHCTKFKSMSHHDACTPTPPNKCTNQVSTSYSLGFPRYRRQDFIGRGHYGKVKSMSHHDAAHLHPLTNVPNKYQLPTPYGFLDTGRTNFFPPARRPIRTPAVKTIPRQPLRAVE